MNICKATVFMLVVYTIAVDLSRVACATNEVTGVQPSLAKFVSMFDSLYSIVIYGKVIDQYSNVVSGAQVKIGWESAAGLIGEPDPGQDSWVTSDASGLWEFRIAKPYRAFVLDTCKPGYEYVYTQESDGNLVENKTTEANPVAVHLRKKEAASLLLLREGYQLIRVFSPHSQANILNLLAENGDELATGCYADLSVAVDCDGTTGKWIVTYSATNGTDGVVICNDILYEAPLDGYQNKVVLNGPPWPRYLYLRSRSPKIYSRLDLEHSTWKESETNEGFRISYKAWINPYGSRNLEYASELDEQWQLRKQLEQAAEADLSQNKRPTAPDLSKLLEEAKGKSNPLTP